jgi:hypothetical protein
VNSFFLAPTLPDTPAPTHIEKLPTKRKTYRATALHDTLGKQLFDWRKQVHSDDPVYRSFPISYLLSDTGLDALAKAKPTTVTTKESIISILEESPEWGDDFAEEVLCIIQAYDEELEEAKRLFQWEKRLARTAARLKAKRMAGRPNGEDSDDEEPKSEDEEVIEVPQIEPPSSDEEDSGTSPNDEDIDPASDVEAGQNSHSAPESSESGSSASPKSSPSGSRCVSPTPPQPFPKRVHPRPPEQLNENRP